MSEFSTPHIEQETQQDDQFKHLASVDNFPPNNQKKELEQITLWQQAKENIASLLQLPTIDLEKVKKGLEKIAADAYQSFEDKTLNLEEGYETRNVSQETRYAGEDPYKLWASLRFISVSREKAQLLAEIADSINSLFPDSKSNPFHKLLTELKLMNKLPEHFSDANEVLVHSGDTDTIASIVTSGFLGSKKAQLDTLGKARFSTGGVEIEKVEDRYKVTNKTTGGVRFLSENELYTEQAGSKHLMQETHDVCFNTDSIYTLYQEVGVSIILNKVEILQNTQFMEADGLHIYPEDYAGETSSTGFALNLEQTNYLVHVPEGSEKQFVTSLLKLVKNGETSLEAAIAWYTQHVIRTKKTSIEEARKTFFQTFSTNSEAGTFLPSDTLVTTPGNQSEAQLVSYQGNTQKTKQAFTPLNHRADIQKLFFSVRDEIESKKEKQRQLEARLPEVPW